MFPNRSKLLAFALAVLVTVGFASVAEAGWVTFKNETNKTITVQETVTVNGKTLRGKPTKLLPGESFREFQNAPGVKSYEVLDPANMNPNTPPLWSGNLNCKADSQAFAIGVIQNRVIVVQVPEPKKN